MGSKHETSDLWRRLLRWCRCRCLAALTCSLALEASCSGRPVAAPPTGASTTDSQLLQPRREAVHR